jgi:hypothetical protein
MVVETSVVVKTLITAVFLGSPSGSIAKTVSNLQVIITAMNKAMPSQVEYIPKAEGVNCLAKINVPKIGITCEMTVPVRMEPTFFR